MVGGTVFDRATQTGEGGATSKGVRSHPPYNAEWEAIYRRISSGATKSLSRHDLELRRAGRIPASLQPSRSYEFVVRPEQTWVLTENGPNVMRIYTDGRKHLEDQWETYTGDSVGRWKATRSSSRPWR